MSILAIVIYISCILFFIFYIFEKYNRRKYIFSIFNISTFVYFFMILISPIFFFYDVSWYALGIYNAQYMKDYLNQSLIINGIGFDIYLLVLYLFEFRVRTSKRIIRQEYKCARYINKSSIDILFIISCTAWYLIVLVYCHGFPLFNGNRSFFLDTPISPIYSLLNEIIFCITLYYGFLFSNKHKSGLKLIFGIVTQLLTGNRGNVLISVILVVIIMVLYRRKNINVEIKLLLKKKKKYIRRIIVFVPIILLFGIGLGVLRGGGDALSLSFINEILYGNNFSDIRDGAYILKGFEDSLNCKHILGKTYLASFLSFIPSSIFKFRYEWSWGRFTTLGLFGMTNHFGLRGGNSLEGYINFGILGVLLCNFIQAYLLAILEKRFYSVFVSEQSDVEGQSFFIWRIFSCIIGIFVCSSSGYNLYVDLIMLVILAIISAIIAPYKSRNCRV